MIRSVKIHSPINKTKLIKIRGALEVYNKCANYFIARLWSENNFEGRYLNTAYIKPAIKRFGLTYRFTQRASNEAIAIVKSQKHKSLNKRRMPRFRKLTAGLTNSFWSITDQHGCYDWIKLQSVGFILYIPFKKTVLWNKWISNGFILANGIRLSIKKDSLYIEFLFEKENPKIKQGGSIEGLDLGYVNLAACSDGQFIGNHFNSSIKKFGKREKHTHEQIRHRTFQKLKGLNLSHIKTLILEDLKYVKHNTRGMFSRKHNRRLSHWLYAKVREWLRQRCEEQGVELKFVSPSQTSFFCRFCGKWDKRNRKGERFKCVHCGHEEHADSNASQNLKLLGLAGVYSLRLLSTFYSEGNYVPNVVLSMAKK